MLSESRFRYRSESQPRSRSRSQSQSGPIRLNPRPLNPIRQSGLDRIGPDSIRENAVTYCLVSLSDWYTAAAVIEVHLKKIVNT